MKLGRFAFPFVCLALAACEQPFEAETVRLVNDTAQQVIVTAGDDVEVIYAGRAAEFAFPDPEGVNGGELLIETKGCKFIYQLPWPAQDYPWRGISGGLLALQMEGDFKLYAIRPSAGRPERFTDFSKLQTGDFPVAPEQQDCERP
ncbi:MAG TPA: hypothetical protein VGM17_10050 [Rhizomicrobium sp.]|jgi:hypothetical protein